MAKGLNLSLPPRKLNYADYLCPFEVLYRKLQFIPLYWANKTFFKTRLKDIALSSYYSYNSRPAPCNLTKSEITAIKDLSANKNIVIQKADKGNSVVILDRLDYENKMLNILSDSSKFEKLSCPSAYKPCTPYNRIIRQENKIQKFLSLLKMRGVICEDEYKSKNPSGSKPGILYGLGKVHKPNVPMRPILSAIGTPCHALAKFLVPILQQCTPFAKEIASLDCDGLHMGSLDVESLFINIPLEETINLV
ncbi:MAG: hypothetical protein GY696_22555, partial [Gammaproteobacteria bacterium]|nr:hypothetical protein [Gammaproteobacteria bacterium]